MKYRAKSGTVINIPDGLTKKQIAKIKADADNNYGKRAQETANKLGKQLKKADPTPEQPTMPVDPIVTGAGEAVDSKYGTVDPSKAVEVVKGQRAEDVNNQFQLDHPMRMTDQNGNVRVITRDPTTGEITVTDELGGTAKKFKDLADAAAQTWNNDTTRQNAESATYGTLTKYYDRDKAKEMEDAKQELANRGIPYDPAAAQDPNTKNLYGRTVGGIDQKYQGLKDTASQQAVLSGNQAYATNVAAQQAFLNAATSGASQFSGSWSPYQNNIDAGSTDDAKDMLALSAQQYMQKYGIDQDTYIKKKALAQANRGSGSSSSSSSAGGFEITS